MVRIRSLLIFFCCLTMLIWSCKQESQPPAPSSTGVNVTNTSDTGGRGPGGGGGATPNCQPTQTIMLHVNDLNDDVAAPEAKAVAGDCISWVADNGGNATEIRFMNSDDDVGAYPKPHP